MAALPLIMQFVGFANSGKTTIVTQLVRDFQSRHHRVGVIKHDGHDHDWDEGKDTHRFRQAGAPLVAIQSQSKTGWFEQAAVPLERLVARMEAAGADIVLIEGFKRADYRKLAFIRSEADLPLLAEVTNCCGIVSWVPLAPQKLPVFSIDDWRQIGDFLLDLHEQERSADSGESI
ncbi:molybdopterin-guanine dinucleotide biosynthesis protein B [Brevibacillus sp. B_LB10_24]|uniref:molybdopterin-guanine dinucleotide biosynthesis protein B n=1 Tax=Brevibacillus sp. B_LB10_24 TaxID=3380645 RepID=UPI0038BCA661